jgi:hypothetical protein
MAIARFNLRGANGALSYLPDRSRLVLPNVNDPQGRIGLGAQPLPAAHHVASLILVPGSGSSARNVTGGRKLARHDSWCD